jgi:hypothetical protein
MEIAHTDSEFSRCNRAMRQRPRPRAWHRALLPLLAALASWFCGECANAAEIASPIQVVYQFINDSSGAHPGPTSTIILGFSPGNEAYLYAMSAKHSTAYHGRWSYTNGNMSIQFTSTDFNVDAHFALNLAEPQVTMPFQVLSGEPGQSRWQMNGVGIENGIFAVYRAARADDALGISKADAVKRAFAYAQSRLQMQRSLQRADASRTGPGGANHWAARLYDAVLPAAYADAPCQQNNPNEVQDAKAAGPDMIHVIYCTGPDEWLYLGDSAEVPGNTPNLHTATLTGDPRVQLDPLHPGAALDDPVSRTALIISPFTSAAPNSTDGYQNEPLGPVNERKDIDDAMKQLSAQGYTVQDLVNQDATLLNIVGALSRLKDPGIIDWEGHGGTGEVLFTYDHSPIFRGLTTSGFHQDLIAWYDGYLNQMKSSGLEGLILYAAPPPGSPTRSSTIILALVDAPGIFNLRGFVAVTPKFWEWATQRKGLDLQRSLALMNACYTTDGPNLAEAIQARAFIGWNDEPSYALALATQKYLLSALSRPTHSAEESVYNMLRVAKTRAMIYKEDPLLNGAVGLPGSPLVNDDIDTDLIRALHAYGWDGAKLIDYSEHGWVENHPVMNAGQVWWLLFAERWSQDTRTGAGNLKTCFDKAWGQGDLGNAFQLMLCHNANTGRVPTRDEVAYAMYLLTGEDSLGFGGTKVPRWTMNDAR